MQKQKITAKIILAIFISSLLSFYPAPPTRAAGSLLYKGVDVMKWTKDTITNQPSDTLINNIVAAITSTVAPTHIAMSVPLDPTGDYPAFSTPSPRTAEAFTQTWSDSIHNHGAKVLWRGTFAGIEGIYNFQQKVGANRFPAGTAASAATDGNNTWLGKIYLYITNHPTFFQNGDIWAPLPERTEGIFQDSSSFLPSTGPGLQANYANFFNDLKTVSTQAFNVIGKNVVTGLTTNNFTEVNSTWLPQSIFDTAGMTVVDHYGLTHTPQEMDANLRFIYAQRGKPIFLQEWGDYWDSSLSTADRTAYLNSMYTVFKNLVSDGILVGFNYWGAWDNSGEGILTDLGNNNYQINSRGLMVASFFGAVPAPTPTPTPSPTATPTPTITPTPTPTPTTTPTPTATPTPKPSATPTPTPTPIATPTPTPTPSPSATPKPSLTPTPTPLPSTIQTSGSGSPSPTGLSPTPTPTPTSAPTSPAPTPTITQTPSPIPTPTIAPTPSQSGLNNVQAVNITKTSAVITWSTNVPTDARVEYGIGSYTKSTATFSTQTKTQNHRVTLRSLQSGTLYNFHVISKDKNGNTFVSNNGGFTTLGINNQTSLKNSSATSVVLPQNSKDGEVVKFGVNPTVYLIKADGLYPFDTYSSFTAYIRSAGVKLKTLNADVNLFTIKPVLAKDILAQGTQPLFGSNGAVLGDSTALPDGSLIQLGQTIYVLSNQVLVPFADLATFKALGYSLSNVIKLDSTTYPTAQNYKLDNSSQPHPAGSWIIYQNAAYYVQSSGIVAVPNLQTFQSNGGRTELLLPANNADVVGINTRLERAPMTANDSRVR